MKNLPPNVLNTPSEPSTYEGVPMGEPYTWEPKENAATQVEVMSVSELIFSDNPDGSGSQSVSLMECSEETDYVKDGVYTSPYHHFSLAVPAVDGGNEINILQSLISSRPDNKTITAHVLFNKYGSDAFCGLVVTRLRDDRPKNPENVLSTYEPKTHESFKAASEAGVNYVKRNGPLGLMLERSIRNRVFNEHYPYEVSIAEHPTQNTLGLSRYLVIGDFFYEFCTIVTVEATTSYEQLGVVANLELDELMAGLVKQAQ